MLCNIWELPIPRYVQTNCVLGRIMARQRLLKGVGQLSMYIETRRAQVHPLNTERAVQIHYFTNWIEDSLAPARQGIIDIAPFDLSELLDTSMMTAPLLCGRAYSRIQPYSLAWSGSG